MKVKGDIADSSPIHGVFCGTKKPSPITSHGNTLLVEFISDNTVQRTGFEAYFFTGEIQCRIVLISTLSKATKQARKANTT